MDNEISAEIIPFFLVTGFLGSGKTTLLKNILASYSGGKRITFIQNDFEIKIAILGFLISVFLDCIYA